MNRQTDFKGLTSAQAKVRLTENGENSLQNKEKPKPIKILLSQFKDIFTLILLASTVLSVLMGEITEAIAIIAIVFINAVIGFFQEYKTEKTLDALKKLAAPVSKVMRDGIMVSIPSKDIVTEDIVIIEAGDKIPADSKILDCYAFEVDESILTGESVPVVKTISNTVSSDHFKQNIVYMGTIATKGRAVCEVVATGMHTEMGKIASMLKEIEDEQTPLQKKLDQLGKYIGILCIIICAVVSLTGILRGENIFDMIITGISLSVAAIPEGLPAIVTIALALAVGRMLKRNALIRKLHAVETLGCANVICSDKTGTLTQNKMTVKHIYTMDNAKEIDGEFVLNTEKDSDLSKLIDICVLCNNSEVVADEQDYKSRLSRNRSVLTVPKITKTSGDPTEIALLELSALTGKLPNDIAGRYLRYDEIPFDSERKCMTVFAKRLNDCYAFCKGGVDVIIDKCVYYQINGNIQMLTPTVKRSILAENERLAKKAMRVLGLAYKTLQSPNDRNENNLVFVGLVGMIDPPRKEAFDAVNKCRRAGIRPVMITGDHKDTAVAIAKELGIFKAGNTVLIGAEIDKMTDAEFEDSILSTSVFARVNPNHKLKIVRALKKKGLVVAMTGDGVNDAPAIKEADIGVSMGITGTDVTKEASSIILLDDNFATLVAAVEEGRIIYQNIRKFIRYLLSCNIGEVLTMFLGMLMGLPTVLMPIQILLVNLVTDGLPAIALGLETGDEDIMRAKPRGAKEGIFSGGLLSKIIVRGCLIGITTLGVFVSLTKHYQSVDIARTGAFLTLVLTQLIHVFECKSETKNLFNINLLNNMKLLLSVLLSAVSIFAVIYVPVLQPIFKTVALSLNQLLIVFGYCMIAPILSALVHNSTETSKKKRTEK